MLCVEDITIHRCKGKRIRYINTHTDITHFGTHLDTSDEEKMG